MFNKALVKDLMAKKGYTLESLAYELTSRGAQITKAGVASWFRSSGVAEPKDKSKQILAEILEVTLSQIEGIEESEIKLDSKDIRNVGLLEMRAGFGTEGTLDPDFKVERCIKLPQEFLGKVNAKYAKIIQCYGDSMLPEFNDGDYILVEMLGGRDYIKRPSIYLVRLGDVVYIKRIEFLPNNDIRLISINPAYPPFLASETGYEWEILGAVYGKISVKLGSGFQFSEQGVKGK
ncbi:MAG: hypothetical protein MR769_05920 [Campylobacter sp.]|uniref:S24 family peptidase n=1 Tax=Campylobacter sp. TaxID=205 RepID=UPI002AA90F7C|nr:S24 family peptidase [Campylobacter sp.]MCI6344205.1 hypothetical protein [Campylobacter sp.]